MGTEIPPFEMRIEAGTNRYLLEALEEDDPIFLDEEEASAAGLPGRPALPGALTGPAGVGYPDPLELMGTSYMTTMMGSADYEYARLPLVGEVFTCRGRVSDVRVKETAKGRMTFATLEHEFLDAEGKTVVVERLTMIERT